MAFQVDLGGRLALVTGAGQGVGRGVALALASAGARVLVNDVAADRADAVASEIGGLGGSAAPACFDVTDHAAVAAAATRAGPVDILVNNAGNAGATSPADGSAMPGLGPFSESDPADWDRYLRVNLLGVLNCCHAMLPAMVARGWGRIMTVVSDAGRVGERNLAVYGAAKAGAAGLTRALAAENGRHGVTANNLSLGAMHTPLTDPLWADPDQPAARSILRSYAVRRPGTPDDVGPLVAFLASDHAAWITGQTIPVNGGHSFSL